MTPLRKLPRIIALLFSLPSLPLFATPPADDPHYTPAGFFDIHVCNWPDQPLFLMALLSTTQFRDIARIDIVAPDGTSLGPMDLNRYRSAGGSGAEEKRVLITHYPIPEAKPDGWYRARITMKNGSAHESKDHVVKEVLPFVVGHQPGDGAEGVAMPAVLKWDPVPGASHYQVYLRDEWESERYLLTSKIIAETSLPLPPGLLKNGGSYSWRVHARNINGSPEWGDFNHGSLAREAKFSIAD